MSLQAKLSRFHIHVAHVLESRTRASGYAFRGSGLRPLIFEQCGGTPHLQAGRSRYIISGNSLAYEGASHQAWLWRQVSHLPVRRASRPTTRRHHSPPGAPIQAAGRRLHWHAGRVPPHSAHGQVVLVVPSLGRAAATRAAFPALVFVGGAFPASRTQPKKAKNTTADCTDDTNFSEDE